MARQMVARLLIAAAMLTVVLPATTAGAREKICLVWVWIDGWRCAVGI